MYHDNLVGLFIFSLGIMTTLVYSKTDSQDVSALNVMFTSMNSPSQLSGWKSSGGDPCGESWKGIKCSGSSVTEIKISGIGVSGSLGYQLSNLKSVKSFDVSSNNLNNQIPYQLPPNVDHLDLSKNSFSGTVPYSISQMSGLKYLNLGHNQLNSQVTDMFQKLTKLEYMDLSHNKLSGDLPSSLKSLSKLKKLFLQDNQLSGSINVLADLPLDELDVQNNKFTGWVPEQLKDIAKTGGNTWSSSPAPPPPPGAKPITRRKSGESSKSSSSSTVINAVIIAASVFGGLAIIAIVVVFIVRSKKKSSLSSFYDEEERGSRRGSFSPFTKRELSNRLRSFKSINYRDNKSLKSSDATDQIKPLQRAPSISSKDQFSGRIESFRDNEFANLLNAKKSTSVRATSFALSDLQTATANFAGGRLLGQGTIGRVYRAKYPDGKVLAVKKIDSSLFQGEGPGKFSSIVACISKIRHINIAELVGYCSDQGHHLLIYEYYRNGSLHDFLHMSDDFSKPLTWNTRIRIALGTARAIEHLHEVTSPTLIHKNIKSPNILLDLELNPNLSDYGLSEFYQRTSQNLGVGYNAPECTKPSAYTMKSDVYSFGVVMLELLSGRMPYDSKKPKSEQCLVRWATPQLHDIDALARMVDPALRGLYPPKSLSRFADIIALCVQPEPEFRPPMSEVVEALVRLVQNSSMSMKDDLAASYRSEDDYF